MIGRAIENWLINTNERNYQLPFCQILLKKGHNILYVSKHRPLEQGKDIISVDNNGKKIAYQLKTGNIGISYWRRIHGEIVDLVSLPVKHPSIGKKVNHNSFLVTNGEISDEVRTRISDFNDDNIAKNRKWSYLDVITKNSLLQDFVDAQGEFIPKEPKDFELYLNFFLADGTDFLKKEKFFKLFNESVFTSINNMKSNLINAIGSSLILCSYSLKNFQDKQNHYALFEAWIILSALINRFASINNLKEKYWLESYKLAFEEAILILEELKKDVLSRKNFLEGDRLGDGDIVYKTRISIILGVLAALELFRCKNDKKYPADQRISKLILDNLSNMWFWGESALPYFFYIIKYLELNKESFKAKELLQEYFIKLVENNSPDSNEGFANPYINHVELLKHELNLRHLNDDSESTFEHFDYRNFAGSSFILESIIQMIVRRDMKELLETHWKKISHITFREFKPDKIEDLFLWRVENGTNISNFPNKTQSWDKLREGANDIDNIPDMFKKQLDIVSFFILVCPHRANTFFIKLIDLNY